MREPFLRSLVRRLLGLRTLSEEDDFALQDMIEEAEFFERLAATKPEHARYAAQCRARVERFKHGGAHKATVTRRFD